LLKWQNLDAVFQRGFNKAAVALANKIPERSGQWPSKIDPMRSLRLSRVKPGYLPISPTPPQVRKIPMLT